MFRFFENLIDAFRPHDESMPPATLAGFYWYYTRQVWPVLACLLVVGLFALNFQGLQGGLLTMINLGFSTAGLFFIAGFLLHRRQTTDLSACGGLAQKMPLLATFLLIIGMASIGLPGTNGFVGEFLILLGTFQASKFAGVLAVSGVILGAAYFLWYYERAMFGPLGETVPQFLADLNIREKAICVSLSVMIFWIGLYPSPFLRMMNGSLHALVERLERGSTAAVAPASATASVVLTDVSRSGRD